MVVNEAKKIIGINVKLQDSGKFIKIFPQNLDQFREFQKYINDKKKNSAFPRNPPGERPLKIIIKGVPSDMKSDEVKNELINKGYNGSQVRHPNLCTSVI